MIISWVRYSGLKSCKILYINNHILNWIQYLTGSQWRLNNTGVMWEYFFTPHMSQRPTEPLNHWWSNVSDAISENFNFHRNVTILLEEGKTLLIKWNISQNNREKHGFTLNMYQNEFMVKCHHKIVSEISNFKVFVLIFKGNYQYFNGIVLFSVFPL